MDVHPEEQLIWRGHPSARAYAGWFAQWGLIALLPAIFTALMLQADKGIGMAWWKWAAVSAGLLILVAVVNLLRRAATDYVVTDRRIRIRRGILSRREQSAPLDKVQNITTEQSLLARMLRIGTVAFDTAGSGTAGSTLRFSGIANPAGLVERLERLRPSDDVTEVR